MSDPRERVLEQALERVLSNSDREAAQTRRIVAAWERGDPAPRLEGAHFAAGAETASSAPAATRPQPPKPPPIAAYPRTRYPLRRVAAIAVAAGLLAAFLASRLARDRDPAPPISPAAPRGAPFVARAAQPVTLERAGADVVATEIFPGDAVRTADEPAELELAGLGELELAPASLLEFRESGPALLVGRARLAARAPLALALGSARLEAAPGARIAFALEPEGSAPPAGVHPWAWLRSAGSAAPPLVLRVAVVDGDAQLSSEPWALKLTRGDVRVVRAGELPRGARAQGAEVERDLVLQRLARLWPARVKDARMRGTWYEAGMKEVDDFVAFLDVRPARWEVLAELALADAADPSVPSTQKTAWVFLVLASVSPDATALARELWLFAPEAFWSAHVVALAERGAFEHEREARSLVLEPDEALEEAFLPACWLAAAGEESARKILREVLAAPAVQGSKDTLELDRRWIAACALAHGGERGPWLELQRALPSEVEAALELDSLDHGARLVLLAAYFREHLDSPPFYGLVEYSWMRFFDERRPALGSADEVRAALEKLR